MDAMSWTWHLQRNKSVPDLLFALKNSWFIGEDIYINSMIPQTPSKYQIAGLEVNYGISNTIMLEIP